MFNFFKRSDAASVKPSVGRMTRKPAPKQGETPLVPNPLPIPEMLEGNEDSDWALWEDSVAFQDSQMQGPLPRVDLAPRLAPRPGNSSDTLDPFASVRRTSS